MKPLLLPILMLFLFSSFTYAEEKEPEMSIQERFIDALAEAEIEDMCAELETWTDQKVIGFLSDLKIEENDVRELYRKFKATNVNPPNPDTYIEYSIENAEESLVEVERLGRRMHNIFLAMSDEDFAKYGRLVGIMRDVLFIDWKHIPYAVKHNNARDLYWHELHTKGVKEAEREYLRLFGNE